MERIPQNSVSLAVTEPDLTAPVVFFPIRHHSPVCAWQLRRLIEAYGPSCILVEGPENANGLLSILTDPATELPAALYYFYHDKKKRLSDEGRGYSCYYPFVYASPEHTALTVGRGNGVPAYFIDLPYHDILLHTKDANGLRRDQERHSYTDDSHLTSAAFYKAVCEKTGVRSFEELWEKRFEIGGLRLEPGAFVRLMLTDCLIARELTPPDVLEADGTLVREQHMAFRIREAMAVHPRVLVVTGGFHTPALMERIQKKEKDVHMASVPADQQGCYVIPYSYEAADALRGYASGMPHPGYYDRIYKTMTMRGTAEGVYADVGLALLTETAKACSEKDLPLSIADVTAAWTAAQGLAALRDSTAPGYAEIADGVTSAMVKGELTAASSLPLRLLSAAATGTGMGRIGDRSHVPPLVQDFERACAKYRLKIATIVPADAETALFTSERELEKSRFFHRMRMLETGFAERKAGPDLHGSRDRSRVRELWRYARTPAVDAALIDHTTDGQTLAEACRGTASRRIAASGRSGTAAHVMVDCFLAGITLAPEDVAKTERLLAEDGDFFSLGEGLHAFDMLYDLRTLYGFEDPAVRQYLERCFSKLIVLVPTMGAVQPEQAGACIKILRALFGTAGRTLPHRMDELRTALEALAGAPQKEPSVHGAAMGLLYAIEPSRLADAERAMRGYLQGAASYRKQGALYLKGLFETARDIALTDTAFIRMTDELLAGMDTDDLMEVLPSLRLAFSCFAPQETQTIADAVAALHGLRADRILWEKAADEALAAFGAEVDAAVFRVLRQEDVIPERSDAP